MRIFDCQKFLSAGIYTLLLSTSCPVANAMEQADGNSPTSVTDTKESDGEIRMRQDCKNFLTQENQKKVFDNFRVAYKDFFKQDLDDNQIRALWEKLANKQNIPDSDLIYDVFWKKHPFVCIPDLESIIDDVIETLQIKQQTKQETTSSISTKMASLIKENVAPEEWSDHLPYRTPFVFKEIMSLLKDGGSGNFPSPYADAEPSTLTVEKKGNNNLIIEISWSSPSVDSPGWWENNEKTIVTQSPMNPDFFIQFFIENSQNPILKEIISQFKEYMTQQSKDNGGVQATTPSLFPGIIPSASDLKHLGKLFSEGQKETHKRKPVGKTTYKSTSIETPQEYGNIVYAGQFYASSDILKFYSDFHDFVTQHPNETILDIGGANGVNTLKYIQNNKVILNDITLNGLAVAQKFTSEQLKGYAGNLWLNILPASEIQLPGNSVTATFIGHLVKYLTGEQLDKLFGNVFKFTKPGGRIFVVELGPKNGWYASHPGKNITPVTEKNPNWPNEIGTFNSQTTYWDKKQQKNLVKLQHYFLNQVTVDDITKALERAGFTIIKTFQLDYFAIIAEKPIAQTK